MPNNISILYDLIKFKLLTPKIYNIDIDNNDLTTIIKYYNKIVKNINKEINLNITEITIDDILYVHNKLITKSIPNTLKIYQLNIANKIDKQSIRLYKYIEGIDCIIYHKINKLSDNILFLIYHNNFEHIKLSYASDVWKLLPVIDYSIYYKINKFLNENPSISYIRCILSHKDYMPESIYLNIINNIRMRNELILYIIYYIKDDTLEIDDNLIFNKLQPILYKNIFNYNEILILDKNLHISIYRHNIINVEKYDIQLYDITSYNPKLKIVLNNNKEILYSDIYIFCYYNRNGKLKLYNNNNNELRLYSNDINIDNNFELQNVFVYNFKLYNTNNLLIKICIANYLYNNDLEKLLLDSKIDLKNETLKSTINKIKELNNYNLYIILFKLGSKSIKTHLKSINIHNLELYYDDLFNFMSFLYDKIH
ncbi:hypothetical protein [Alphaentomopoxvirus acuprea]|uniref:Uncharacterized protein n=1 Tax=Alphaentomopoxvirus acuprea TaxID=62099 RepID=W6JL04_9POXV|nr:hypothetical protein BA82_gp130 [Anomala cuprea entomopoxvirus]BAO49490.1 hypothetical protein [Anomala cuprea entomopoxvirus]